MEESEQAENLEGCYHAAKTKSPGLDEKVVQLDPTSVELIFGINTK